MLQSYVANEATAWYHAREELRRFFERVLSRHREEVAPDGDPAHACSRWPRRAARRRARRIGAYLEQAALLGRRTAEMHLALAPNVEDAELHPRALLALDRRSKYQSMRNLVGKTLRLLRENLDRTPRAVMPMGRGLVDGQDQVLKVFEPYLTRRLTGLRIRTHGDYHLNQLLYTGKDFVLIDFEGLPGETLAERRRKHICLRDVASMIRSFHFAAPGRARDRGRTRRGSGGGRPLGRLLVPLGLRLLPALATWRRPPARLPARRRRHRPHPRHPRHPKSLPRAPRRARSLRRNHHHPFIGHHRARGALTRLRARGGGVAGSRGAGHSPGWGRVP